MRRHLILLITYISCLLSSVAYAQEPVRVDLWDGYTVTAPRGSGTASDPYLIENGANLKWVQQNSSSWGKNFLQTKDIDLGGFPLGMIGYGDRMSVNTNNDHIPFTGVYDGNGLAIKNLVLDLDKQAVPYSGRNDDISFGLFGYVKGATIRNLILDHVTTKCMDISITDDLRIGCLVGAVSPQQNKPTRIQNIAVINSVLSDNGSDPQPRSLFVGGVIGDMANVFGGYSNILPANNTIEIRNLYSDVTFSFPVTTRKSVGDGQTIQFNIGGILGRVRRGNYEMLPLNTFYTGSIEAPLATISPLWGNLRVNAVNDVYEDHVKAYAGEVIKSKTSTGTGADNIVVLDGPTVNVFDINRNVDENRYYSDYKIFDTHNHTFTSFTDTYPEAVSGEPYGIRTLASVASAPTVMTKTDANNPVFWRPLQGVNHGTYINPDNVVQTLAPMYQEYVSANTGLCQWIFDQNQKPYFNHRPGFEMERTGFGSFRATLTRGVVSDYKVRWSALAYETTDEIILAETPFDPSTASCEFTVTDYLERYRYIKATLVGADGAALERNSGIERVYDIDISSYIELYRNGLLSFQARVSPQWLDSRWNQSELDQINYKFKWYAADQDGNSIGEALRTSPTAGITDDFAFTSFTELPHYIKVVLCDSDDQPLPLDGNQAFTIPVTNADENLMDSYSLAMTKQTVGRNSWIVATLYDQDGNIMAGGRIPSIYEPNITFKWEVNSDPSNIRGWEEVNAADPHSSSLMAYASTVYYRVTWRYEGHDQRYAIYGDSKLIFLYSKTDNQMGLTKGFTTFDGMDHWEVDGVEYTAEFPDGDDINDGSDPYKAVLTMERAYQLCNPGHSMYDNTIVVMGFFEGQTKLYTRNDTEGLYAKPASVLGAYGNSIRDGAIELYGDDDLYQTCLQASTRFKDITLRGRDDNSKAGYHRLYLYAQLHDLCIDENVKFKNYSFIGSELGLTPTSVSNSPHIHIIGGYHDPIVSEISYPDDNQEDQVATITIRSGAYGRIIGCSRNNGVNPCNNTFGTPWTPCRTRVVIDIQNPTRSECQTVNLNIKAGTATPWRPIIHDIGLLVGGQTDGNVFAEVELVVKNGFIDRFIAGNISYGRVTSDQTPDDSYFGSTTLTLEGGEINELYGGSLGRKGDTTAAYLTEPCAAYFYGRSIINIEGATIKSNLYGAGAGGVAGVGDDVNHTLDRWIPYIVEYIDGSPGIKYGDYERSKGKIPTIQMRDGSILDLSHTYSEINVYRGKVIGDIFGGGYGFSNELKDQKAINALTQAGNFYGDTRIHISQRPYSETLVQGNIYGGGAGSSYYYTYFKDTAKDPARAELYKHTACVFGDTRVTIDGGTITGDVFAGAKGLQDYPDIAGVYGSTFLEIKGEANVLGNIFGGSDFGSIKKRGVAITSGDPALPASYSEDWGGSTMVHIWQTPIIGNNIFGGCNGRSNMGYRISIADSTFIHIEDGSFIDTPWMDEAQTQYRTFNIYGSGYNNCEVRGNTRVYVQRSLLQNSSSIGVDFKKYWSDLSHRRFCLYGGGYGEDTDVLGTAIVDVNINNNDVLVDPDDGIDFYRGKEIFDVSGGGYSGDVESTQVSINGNAFIRKVIGGGFFGSVRNTTNVHLISGIIFSAFGGCMMGYVHESAHLTVGTRTSDGSSATENSTLWILDNIYGGNDVQGIVGAIPSENTSVVYPELIDPTSPEYSPYDPRVLYQSDINPQSGRGAYLNIYGGHIFGSVYGAGNGHYRGYYVPGWGQYLEGADRYFRNVPSRPDINTPARVYKTRPNVGQVNMNIIGNNEEDYVQIDNKVFGGGRDCTVGRWIPEMLPGDPRRLDLKGGGYLNINFGSHVRVDNSVYLGSQGQSIGVQPTLEGIDPEDLEKAMTLNAQTHYQELHDVVDRLGEAAYYHWYYDSDAQKYKIGFSPKGVMYRNPADTHTGMNPQDPNNPYFLTGEHQFFGYCKFMETAAKINLTFYNEDFADGDFKQMPSDPDLCISGPTGVRYDSEDVSFGSFFLGGEHGFMTYQPEEYVDPSGSGTVITPDMEYSYDIMLPPGLTITDKVVGGSEDSWIKYYPYTDESRTTLDTSAGPLYQTNSGIGVESTFSMLPYPRAQYPEVNPETLEAVIEPGERNTTNAIRLSVVCDFDPQLGPDAVDPVTGKVDKFRRYGGLIYGGCYKSGITSGNVVLNIGANLVGSRNETFYCVDTLCVNQKYASLEYNVGRVFGGGYGQETHVLGDTYVYILNDFKGMNVFGGACLGNVTGQTNVSYLGNPHSYVYGSIYGGSLKGNVGYRTTLDNGQTVANEDKPGSRVALYSGNVAFVYGGSCMGDVYGGTSVDVSNGHLDRENRLRHINWDMIETVDWGTARVVAGRVFGGNDISGKIIHPVNISTMTPYSTPLTHVDVSELTVPVFGDVEKGDDYVYTGFPLVGYLYGGSNANYGTHNNQTQKYSSGTLLLAAGTKTETEIIDLTGNDIPNIADAKIDIFGGTLLNVFGGGNKSTIDTRVDIQVAYVDTIARATLSNVAEPGKAMRLWNMLQMPNADQQNEVSLVNNSLHTTFKYQIFNLFGGNDNADMAIQPRWDLRKGMVGNVFSGGNVGRMTYYNPTADPADEDQYLHSPGLMIAVDSRDIYIGNIYGGGRIGDICATDTDGNPVAFTHEDDYGATVNIRQGFIDHVYGGNDVSGHVSNGTRVNIRGAVSGDIYGAGNGNYIYKYDTQGNCSSVTESFTDAGKRYFLLPRKDDYATRDASGNIQLETSGEYSPTLAENVILAINSYRPNVDRTFIDIQGSASNMVWVKGKVFCGGNSSTISSKRLASPTTSSTQSDIKLNIGSYVNLACVFLGANGRDLVQGQNIYQIEQINGLDFTQDNTLTSASTSALPQGDQDADDHGLYPKLFDLYMRAVEVNNLPNDFAFREDLVQTYIGEFFVGGNHGSMLTDQKVTITFPEQLVIYKHIVGGCNQATVNYKNVTHVGGLNKKPLAEDNDKLHLIVKSRFSPLLVEYPQDKFASPIVVGQDLVDGKGKSLYTLQTDGTYAFNVAGLADKAIYYPEGKCNVYGGCYNSGTTVGNILIDMFSDMIDYSFLQSEPDPTRQEWQDGIIRRASVVNAIDDKNWRSFHVVGGGYGYDTEVRGNITVRMLPGKASGTYTEGFSPRHPSVGGIFGGSMVGHIIGNTRVEVRDGRVLSDVYGASESAILHGSSNVTVGYPTYYKARTFGKYTVKRVDDVSLISREAQKATNPKKNHDDSEIIRRTFNVIPGDIVPLNVYEAIEQQKSDEFFTRVEDHPSMFALETENGFQGAKWDDIEIHVGDQFSMHYKDAPFFSHGNIYGGGYNAVVAHMTLVGQNTVVDFDQDNNVGTASIGHGGNTSVLIWDNPENADLTLDLDTDRASDGSLLKDHITVSSGVFHKVSLKEGQDKMGYYKYDADNKYKFVHQPTGSVTAQEVAQAEAHPFFEFVGDGGVYGGGRTVYAKGFRSIDIANYGYADYAPQQAKQLNTFQRADILTVRDCCLMLQGANDFATNLVDNTSYSINRVGELNMVSSIPLTSTLVDDGRDNEFFGNTLHTTRRCRNYLAFYRTVHFLGSYSSNVPFDTDLHDENGQMTQSTSYMKSKHDIIETYYQDKVAGAKLFERRNQGTSPNMIGINNGYALRIQGNYTEPDPTSTSAENYFEKYYYGPIFGVTEIKLLTLAIGEGGGYIYALNHHYDSSYDKSQALKDIYNDPDSDQGIAPQDFMYTTGNFVFPGAAFLSENGEDYNYIIDDCIPIGTGYDHYHQIYTDANPSSRSSDGFDVNDYTSDPAYGTEGHYWYVNGQRFTFNVTLTAYTKDTDETPENFYLLNDDLLVTLPNLSSDMNLRVNSIQWHRHPEKEEADEDFDCDLLVEKLPGDQGYKDKDYHLFLTVDRNPYLATSSDAAAYQNAFFVELPRHDFYTDGSSTDPTILTGDEHFVNPNDVTTQRGYNEIHPTMANSTTYSSAGNNVAAVGIRLRDAVKNRFSDQDISVGRQYWEDHLQDSHKVRIELKADKDGVTYTYLINLKIDYLLGPSIQGSPVIENCALPGEYIYINSDDVVVDMDGTNMAITERNWYILPVDDQGNEKEDKMVQVNEYKYKGDRVVRLPAFYYQNGWKVWYVVKANGQNLKVRVENTQEHPALEIHNYHRMDAFDGSHRHDLRLTPGARIYIEDQRDFQRFLQYLDSVQYDESYQVTDIELAHTDGHIIHPRFAQGLDFYLQDNVQVPESLSPEHSLLIFKGNFHGNGYHINIGEHITLPFDNEGKVYNTGFISIKNDDNTCVFNDNTSGHIENCYYFNLWGKGWLAKQGDMVNCYQNTSVAPEFSSTHPNGGLLQLSTNAFCYGQVAYNLNGFYLKKRDLLLRRADAVNSQEYLESADTDFKDDEKVEYIEKMFNNGDYRYALYDPKGNFKEALRTYVIPNYFDMMGLHEKQQSPTHHNTEHPDDELRPLGVEPNPEIHHPQLAYDDYLFFGQEISAEASEREPILDLPCQFTAETRVYRVSGFYGSKMDRGFFLNKSAYIGSPIVTAIDFTGIRDKDPGIIANINTLRRRQDWNGWLMKEAGGQDYTLGLQETFYPPMLDISITEREDINEITLHVGKDVTHNLLVYGHQLSSAIKDIYQIFHYQDKGAPATDHERALYDNSSIIGHHIVVNDEDSVPAKHTYQVYGGFMDLVDKHSFNAPTPISYQQLWYNRKPSGYADQFNNLVTDKSAWEGIYLPYTVEKVYSAAMGNNVKTDHGQITHFYDDSQILHEYWLRRPTSIDKDGDMLLGRFESPKATNQTGYDGRGEDAIAASYSYLNTYFWDAYGEFGYEPIEDFTHHNAYNGRHTFTDYRYLTAGIPYIISYPGECYREFDFSGQFYSKTLPGEVPVTPQTICYNGRPNSIIEVTDDLANVVYKIGDYSFRGTFTSLSPTQGSTVLTIPPYDGATNWGQEFQELPTGENVVPFRVYFLKEGSGINPAPAARSIMIAAPTTQEVDPEEEEYPTEEEPSLTSEAPSIKIHVEGRTLVVTSSYPRAFNMPIYNLQGQLLRKLPVFTGQNRYEGFQAGIYLTRHAKFRIGL